MCNKPLLLVLIFIIKLVILFSLPIYCLFKEKNNKIIKHLVRINVLFIIIYIVFTLLNNSCFVNSTIKGILNSIRIDKYSDKTIKISNNPDVVEKIVTNKIYKTNNNKNVYYFNNFELPLSDKKIYCDDKVEYMKNYGNGITAVSILLSSVLDQNIDPIKIYDYAVEKNIFDCEDGVDVVELLYSVASNYNLSLVSIDKTEVANYVRNGNVVLARITYNKNVDNISCGKSNIILYSINKEDSFNILNPSDKNYDYICPDNSIGYGQIIKANTNDSSWPIFNINSISEEYLSLERN